MGMQPPQVGPKRVAAHRRRGHAGREARFAIEDAPHRPDAIGTQWLSAALTIGHNGNIGMIRAVHAKLLFAWSSVIGRRALKTSRTTFPFLVLRSKLAGTCR